MWATLETNIPPIYAKSINEFNAYVDKYKTDNEIILTRNGNISQQTIWHMPASKVWKRGNRMEFHYIDGERRIRVIYALHYDEDSKISDNISYDALNYFRGLMKLIPTDDVEPDCELFTCPENPEASYYGYVNDMYLGVTVNHCYSLDRNNSFMASMLDEYPQTREYVIRYYETRLEKKILKSSDYSKFKLYGSIFVGWLNCPKYHRSHAWKRIVSNSNRVVHELRQKIEKTNTVLLVNTDAIKFIGKFDYEGSDELGCFKYEWKDTDMFIRGIKSYGYVDESGRWRFKQAGKCALDFDKERDDWTLEDYKKMTEVKVSKIKIVDGKLKEVLG